MERYLPEAKMTGSITAQNAALALLDHFCEPDPIYPRGEIHSVYYDTPCQHAYHDKANGDFLKSKARLRWYQPDISADPAKSTAFFELKRRAGGGRRKSRSKLSLDRQWLHHAPLEDVGFMRILDEQRSELGAELAADLFPMAVVKYTRYRYVYQPLAARVAVDTRIGSGRVHSTFLPRATDMEIPVTVLEVKSDKPCELPWLHEVFNIGFRSRSFSKYGACMAQLLGDER
jgi:hypothetical protein